MKVGLHMPSTMRCFSAYVCPSQRRWSLGYCSFPRCSFDDFFMRWFWANPKHFTLPKTVLTPMAEEGMFVIMGRSQVSRLASSTRFMPIGPWPGVTFAWAGRCVHLMMNGGNSLKMTGLFSTSAPVDRLADIQISICAMTRCGSSVSIASQRPRT